MLLIGGGTLVTRDGTAPLLYDGCAALDGPVIVEVGKTALLRAKFPQAEYIDAEGGLIMPGFINTHMHFYSTFSRGMTVPGEPASDLDGVLKNLWWRLDKALDLTGCFYSAATALVEAVSCGCTTIIDHHASPHAVSGSLSARARAAEAAGVRASLCYEVSDRDGEAIAREGIRENMAFLDWCAREKKPTLAGKFGLHASFTLSDKTLESCREAMAGRDEGFHVHVAEGPADEPDCRAKYGTGIVRRFDRLGITGKNSIFAHCIHIDEEERALLAETGTAVIHNPESNMGNAVGAADIPGLSAEGVLLGLGTDGYLCDMLQSLKMGNALCKHSQRNPNKGWSELPAMLFAGNEDIAERAFPVKLGKLKPGYAADVIILDYLPPTPLTKENINGQLLFGASARTVRTTVANGRVLMKDRKLTTVDREEIFAKAREEALKTWKRL